MDMFEQWPQLLLAMACAFGAGGLLLLFTMFLSRRMDPPEKKKASPVQQHSYRGAFPDGWEKQAHRAINMARMSGLKTPREAMERHLGMPVSDDLWERSRAHWEREWAEIEENALTTR